MLRNAKQKTNDEDLILAAACARGDEQAQESLYTDNYRKVYCLCLRILKNEALAEDLAQDSFIQIFRKIHSFKGDSKLNTWIHRLVVNQCLMHLRKDKSNAFISLAEAEDYVPPEIPERTDSRTKLNNRILLEQCINQLADGYRNTLILHDIAGYDHKEVGVILGCSEGTSKSQLWKARDKMRRLISKKANPRLLPSFI